VDLAENSYLGAVNRREFLKVHRRRRSAREEKNSLKTSGIPLGPPKSHTLVLELFYSTEPETKPQQEKFICSAFNNAKFFILTRREREKSTF
jgi:hypothetical protein